MSKAKNIKLFFIIFILQSLNVLAAGNINKITIEGNQRIETSTIENYLDISIGEQYNPAKISNALKHLYATSLFKDVDISYNNNVLHVKVVENPFISKVELSGNSKITTKTILQELSTQAGESLNNAKLQEDVKKIQHMYKSAGRFATKISTKTEQLDQNRIKVIFDIKEGPKTTVQNIYFVGNESYTSSELKDIINTKESKWWRFLEKNDTYDPYRMDYDKELLIDFYRSIGYVDVNIISAIAELSPTKESFDITYTIDEGNKYTISNIDLDNKLGIYQDEIYKLITIKSGQIYNSKKLDNISEQINKYLSNLGYAQIDIKHEIVNKDPSKKIVCVKYVIEKAIKVYVNHINIDGNLKTNEEVIRREFRVSEGDILNRNAIEEADNNLKGLDYFEKVNINAIPVSQDRYDVNVELQEKSTSSLSFDFGYSTAAGPLGKISFTENNLFGQGKTFSVGMDVTRSSHSYFLIVGNPYFLNRPLNLSLATFISHEGKTRFKKRKVKIFNPEQQPYNKDSIAFKPSLEYNINDYVSHSIDYTIKREKLTGDRNTLAKSIAEQLGTYITSAIGHTLVYMDVDNRIIPKNGFTTSFSQEYAGLGGNNKYLKHELEGRYLYSILNNKVTFKLLGRAGDIRGVQGKKVMIADKFYLGEYTLRGFENKGVGPRDKKTDEALGGLHFYSATAETIFPITNTTDFDLKGLVFADIGSVWGIDFKRNRNYNRKDFYNDKSPRASIGFGFIWNTRLAPIRMDFGFPIKRKKYDETQHFHLKFSTHF